MKILWVLLLMMLVCQAPASTYNTHAGFACKTPDLWREYAKAIDTHNAKTIRNVRLSQRCVDIETGEVEVLDRVPGFLLIRAKDSRKLYIPKAYVKE